MRCDYGTENCLIGTAHIAFRLDSTDEDTAKKSFLYGTSPANTVSIIASWSIVCWNTQLV